LAGISKRCAFYHARGHVRGMPRGLAWHLKQKEARFQLSSEIG
jgi:hypothetical protein